MKERTTVVDFRVDEYDEYIGRENHHYGVEQSIFHNPFKVGEDGDRQEVIRKFREYFYDRMEHSSEFKQQVEDLEGKVLGCWCKPKDCHGDVIAAYLNDSSSGPALDW